MPKMTLRDRLTACEADNISLTQQLNNAEQARGAANQRVKEIAAENETLRIDKKWLQQMHSNVLQAMFEHARNK